MGYVTAFFYDGAGSLSKVHRNDHTTEYVYDRLGRLLRTFESTHAGEHIETIETRDFLDRVIKRRKVFSDGTMLSRQKFAYDIRGNCTDITSFTTSDTSTAIHTDFSTRNMPVRVTDASGNATEISYDYG